MYHIYGQIAKIYKIILLICYPFFSLLHFKVEKESLNKVHKLKKLFKL
jgi:hypothetical protein